jgi:cytochrome c biogenesis protein CcdA
VLALAALVMSIGIADSLNPSTIAPALYYASHTHATRRILGFMAGVFCVSTAVGLLLTFGPGEAILALLPHPSSNTKHWLEVGFGIVALVVTVGLFIARAHVTARFDRRETRPSRPPFLLGAGIIAVELPTAFPYFAAIAAIVGSRRSIPEQTLLIVIFNLTFIAPLGAILLLRALAGARGERILEQFRRSLERRLGILLPAIVFLIAIVLLALGGIGLFRSHHH